MNPWFWIERNTTKWTRITGNSKKSKGWRPTLRFASQSQKIWASPSLKEGRSPEKIGSKGSRTTRATRWTCSYKENLYLPKWKFRKTVQTSGEKYFRNRKESWTSYHLAHLEFTTTEEYEWMGLEITESEIKEAFRLMKNDTSPGIDKMTKEKIKGLGAKILKKWYNRWLDEGIIPKPLKRFKLTLIPKIEGAELSKDFRPISVGSMMRRVFSKILNARISQIKTSNSQSLKLERKVAPSTSESCQTS